MEKGARRDARLPTRPTLTRLFPDMNVNKSLNVSGTTPLGQSGGTQELGSLDGMTLAQGTPVPKKSFKTQVKELFRDIGRFFKSLTQRKAVVGEPSTTRGGATKGGTGLGGVDFAQAKSFKPMSSGNGGACFVKMGNSTVVVKGGGGGAPREVYGAQLARELGLSAPETRLLSGTEKQTISHEMGRKGVSMPERTGGGDEPEIVMEFVKGKTIGDLSGGDKVSSEDVAKSFGKWIGFAAFINEPDTFHGLISGRQYTAGGGINSSNFMIDPKHPERGIVGIDQNVSSGDNSDLIKEMLEGGEAFFMRAAGMIARTIGDDVDPEMLVPLVKQGVQEVFEAISQMSPDRIQQLGEDLGIDGTTIQALQDRQSQIAQG